jgi:hypothetical protein
MDNKEGFVPDAPFLNPSVISDKRFFITPDSYYYNSLWGKGEGNQEIA